MKVMPMIISEEAPLKLLRDGSLGARTAMMRIGYAETLENHGIQVIIQTII